MAGQKEVKISLGSGSIDFGKDWYHIDAGNYKHLTSKNITKLPYKDNSVDLIYASHVLEYFDREEALDVIKEWRRVLKKGGELRIAVPDFEAMNELYTKGKAQLNNILGPLYGKMESGDKIIYHKTVYDFFGLKALLTTFGFKEIMKYHWRQTSPHDEVDDQSQSYLNPRGCKETGTLISLNLRCKK